MQYPLILLNFTLSSYLLNFAVFMFVQVLYFVDAKNLDMGNYVKSSAWLHQTSACYIAWGSCVIHQDNSSRLHSKAPLEEMNGSPDDISLLSSTGFIRGTRVPKTARWRTGVTQFAVNLVLRAHEIHCTCADLPASVRCDVYVQMIWWRARSVLPLQ